MNRALLAIVLVSLVPVSAARADGEGRQAVKPAPTPNQASDASFDKRLPPVLPGEELSDGGRTMKVWSTAGPVPAATPPEAPCPNGEPSCLRPRAMLPNDLSIIVDGRHGERPAPHKGTRY